ncbi:MAG: UMP kinase [archaeon]
MKKMIIVLSLGGSLIIPNEVDVKYLSKFRDTIIRNTIKHKFIIVCGGGTTARKYIRGLKDKSTIIQSTVGIASTRLNAKFMSTFFGQDLKKETPIKIKQIKKLLKKQDIIFCGALEFKPKQTTDSNAAEISEYFKTEFINLTDVQGLYDKNPKKYKNAKLISKISWKDFHKIANKLGFKPGQHFVLDQTASKIIKENKIPTYILGKNLMQLDKLLKGKKFVGTLIKG